MVSRYSAYEDAVRRSGEDDRTVADLLLDIFRDLDSRIVLSEDQAAGAAAIEKELTDYGTARIEAAISPIVAAIRSAADLGALLTASSVTAIPMEIGPKTFVIGEGQRRMFAPSAMIAAVANDNPAAVMWGRRIAYDASSGELIIDVLSKTGTGTYSSWTISTGAMVEMAAQAVAVAAGDFTGVTVQDLLTQVMTAVAGDPNFAATVAQAIATAKSEGLSEAVNTIRGGVADDLDTLAEIAASLALRIGVGAQQSFSVSQQRQAKANLGALGGQSLVKSTNYTVVEADNGAVILMSAAGGARTVTLPDVSGVGVGMVVTVKKTDGTANVVTVASAASLDGAASLTIALPWQAITLVSDTAGWRVVAESGRPRPLTGSVAKAANYTVTGADNGTVILVDASGAARTITLPAATGVPSGFTLAIKKSDATINTVTVAGTIDGVVNYLLRRPQQIVLLLSDGAVWSVITEAADQPPITRFAAKTANYTVVLADDGATLSMDATAAQRTFTLPSASAVPVGFAVTLRKADTSINAVVVSGTIDGASNAYLSAAYQAITLVSDGAAWISISGRRDTASVGRIRTVAASANVVAADNHAVIAVDASAAARTVTLPDPATLLPGFVVTVKKTDASFNAVTVAGTIDGSVNYVVRLPRQAVKLVSDGAAWLVTEESGTIYTTTLATGRLTRWANGMQSCSATITVDYTGPEVSTNRLSAAWTYPAAFVTGGPESKGIELPMHSGLSFTGITGDLSGRGSVKASGPSSSTSSTTTAFSIFFDAATVNVSTGAISGVAVWAEGMWF